MDLNARPIYASIADSKICLHGTDLNLDGLFVGMAQTNAGLQGVHFERKAQQGRDARRKIDNGNVDAGSTGTSNRKRRAARRTHHARGRSAYGANLPERMRQAICQCAPINGSRQPTCERRARHSFRQSQRSWSSQTPFELANPYRGPDLTSMQHPPPQCW